MFISAAPPRGQMSVTHVLMRCVALFSLADAQAPINLNEGTELLRNLANIGSSLGTFANIANGFAQPPQQQPLLQQPQQPRFSQPAGGLDLLSTLTGGAGRQSQSNSAAANILDAISAFNGGSRVNNGYSDGSLALGRRRYDPFLPAPQPAAPPDAASAILSALGSIGGAQQPSFGSAVSHTSGTAGLFQQLLPNVGNPPQADVQVRTNYPRGAIIPVETHRGAASVAASVPQSHAAVLPQTRPRPPSSPLGQLQFPQLNQLIRQENFGLAKGEGCIPFLGDVVRALFADCQQAAERRQWQAWGGHLNGALTNGKLDVLQAAKETCRLQSERQHCLVLMERVATCDIIGSLSAAGELEQAKQRCDKITLLSLQPPKTGDQLVNKIGDFLGSEVAYSLLQNFLG